MSEPDRAVKLKRTRGATTRTCVERIVRRDQTMWRVESRIAPTERLTRPHEWTIVHDAWAIARHDDLIGRLTLRIVPRGEIT